MIHHIPVRAPKSYWKNTRQFLCYNSNQKPGLYLISFEVEAFQSQFPFLKLTGRCVNSNPVHGQILRGVSVEKVKVRNLGNSHCDTRWGCHGTYHSVSSSVQDWHKVFFSYNPYHWFDCFLISHKITKLRKIDWGSWERLVQKLLQDINNTIISLMYQYRIRYCYNILPILS